ncbi:hypothetical protein GGR52DRAFT_569265 [Hypoxylon sp. FL1284]|nr:hypothetical protein GGR52DRAFT_569265 [Hypoxylon sp. FL1284]
MLPRVSRLNRVQTSRVARHISPLAPLFTSSFPLPAGATAATAATAARGFAVKADQTRQANDPSREHKEEHRSQAAANSNAGARGHPAQQPDPQPSPDRSTGVRTEGPGAAAAGKGHVGGEGVHRDKDVKEKGGQMDRYPYPIRKD